MSRLNNNDYKEILIYYKKPIPKNNKELKLHAEKILAEKLCRCIKKVDPKNQARSIGICTKTIFNRKGYTRGKFKCKGKSTVTFRKTVKNRKT
jgi:hypothetical protein